MSRVVMVYGPPAAGKLTVATAFSDATGFRLVDNHLTGDIALRLFEFGSEPFLALIRVLRAEIYRAAAREGVDIVSTFVYIDEERDVVRASLAELESWGLDVSLVRLCPRREILEERVTGVSRSQRRKLRDVEGLRTYLAQKSTFEECPGTSLSIDNSELEPGGVVARIRAALSV